MANITKAEAQAAIPQMWLAAAIGYLGSYLTLGSRVRRDGDSAIQDHGDVVNVIKRGALTVKEKTAGNPVVPDAPTNSKVAVTLDKHIYCAWHQEDIASAMAYESGLMYVQDAAMQIAEHMEGSLHGLYTEIATEVGTGNTALTKATILEARQQLNTQKAPMGGRILSLSPVAETQVLGLDEFVHADKRGDAAAMTNGQIGRILGFDVLMSQEVKQTGAGPFTQHNIALHPDAFMLVSRALPLPEPGSGAVGTIMTAPGLNVTLRYTRQWDQDELKTKHVIDCLYGVAAIDEDRLAVEVLS